MHLVINTKRPFTADANGTLDDIVTNGVTNDGTAYLAFYADDGAGANDLAQYNIYRSDIETGPWVVGAYIGSVPAGEDTYTDFDKGQLDATYWWYVIGTEDVLGNIEINTNSGQEPGADGSNAFEEFPEIVLSEVAPVFQPLIIHRKAFDDVLTQMLGGPDAELCAPDRFYSVTN